MKKKNQSGIGYIIQCKHFKYFYIVNFYWRMKLMWCTALFPSLYNVWLWIMLVLQASMSQIASCVCLSLSMLDPSSISQLTSAINHTYAQLDICHWVSLICAVFRKNLTYLEPISHLVVYYCSDLSKCVVGKSCFVSFLKIRPFPCRNLVKIILKWRNEVLNMADLEAAVLVSVEWTKMVVSAVLA